MYIIEVHCGHYPFWKLKSTNGQILAHSEGYHSVGNSRRTAKKLWRHIRYCDYKEIKEKDNE